MNPTTLRRITAVLLFLAGAASITLPFISATALTLSIGVIAAVAGVSQLLRLGQAEGTQGKIFRALSGLFYVVAGIWVVAYPVESEISLTLFVGLLLIFEDVMELASGAAGQGHDECGVQHRGISLGLRKNCGWFAGPFQAPVGAPPAFVFLRTAEFFSRT